MEIKIGSKIYYEIESFGNIVRRKGVVVEEYPSFYVVEIELPAHPKSLEKTRRFRETIHKNSCMRVLVEEAIM